MYRDMLVIIRDRIKDMVAKKMTLEQVKAARPTLDYDGRYGADTAPWTTAMFIEAIYRELSRPAGSAQRSARHDLAYRRTSRSRRQPALSPCLGDLSLSRLDRRAAQRGRGARAGGPPRPRDRAGADRPHRHLGVGRHRGLAVADGHAAEGRRRRASRSAPKGARWPTRGTSRPTTRAATSARRSASAASCGSRGACASPGRTTTTLKLEFDAGTQTRLLHFERRPQAAGREDMAGDSPRRVGRPGRREAVRAPRRSARHRRRDTGARCPGRRRQRSSRRPAATPAGSDQRGGDLKVVTTNFREGYLRKNGVPVQRAGVDHGVFPSAAHASQRRQLAPRADDRRRSAVSERSRSTRARTSASRPTDPSSTRYRADGGTAACEDGKHSAVGNCPLRAARHLLPTAYCQAVDRRRDDGTRFRRRGSAPAHARRSR